MPRKKRPPSGITTASGIIVRMATKDDLEAIADLWEELIRYHHRLDRRFWKRAPDGRVKSRDWMAGAIGSTERVLVVAEMSHRVVGFAHGLLKKSPPPMKPCLGGFITDMAVAEPHRGSGIGSLLIEAAQRWFVRHGATELTLTAAVRNKDGLAFWEAMGFEAWMINMWKRL